SIRASSAAWRCISVRARLSRGTVTRVAAYSSKLLRNVPRWRRSKVSTAPSRVTPANAVSITLRDTPAAAASRAMADRNALKSPPHCAAPAGEAINRPPNRKANKPDRMLFLIITAFSSKSRARHVAHQGLGEAAVDHDLL